MTLPGASEVPASDGVCAAEVPELADDGAAVVDGVVGAAASGGAGATDGGGVASGVVVVDVLEDVPVSVVEDSGVVVCARAGTAMLSAAVAMAKAQRFMNGFLSDRTPHADLTSVQVRGSQPAADWDAG
jgi:hypothetical protein